MPKHNKRVTISDRLARRANSIDPRRSDLLARILEEGSSIPLNDESKQQSPRQALEAHSKLFELIEELREVEANLNPKLPHRDQKSIENFFNWIESNSTNKTTDKISERVDVIKLIGNDAQNSQEEYGLVCKVDIKKGENIFSINRRLMLSTETVAKDDDLADFIKADPIASGMQNVILALHLLNEYSKGERSFWQAYLAILPQKTLPVLSMNKEKVNCLLGSSHIFDVLKMIRAITRQYAYFFKRLQSTQLPLVKDFTYDFYCWGVSMVCSRQNEIPHSNRKTSTTPVVQALIPLLDMCNHDPTSNQAVFEGNDSKLSASQDLYKNDQITINYGVRSSGDFFIHNGFVPNEIRHDIVPLVISLHKEDHLFTMKTKLLKTLQMPNFGRFKLTHLDDRHKRDPHLTMFLIVYLMNSDELNYIESCDNPVGVADEIYEYVQYNGTTSCRQQASNGHNKDELNLNKLSAMKERLTSSVREYLSKRASISIALIDRSLKENQLPESEPLSLMMVREKTIYSSHLK